MRPLIRNRPGEIVTQNQDEWGYGTVTLYPTVLSRWNGLKYRIRKPKPVTMHVGWEDENGEFHEEDSWDV